MLTRQSAVTESRIGQFLAALPDPARRPIEATDLAIITAHPDDETIGCGALLPRLKGARLILVTDGAPRNLYDARNYGFPTAEAYAAARHRELEEAVGVAGMPPSAITRLDVPDQEAPQNLAAITRRVVDLLAAWRTAVVLTLAFEGGHPDHDACAFAAIAAARLLARREQRIDVVEMPLYRLDDHGRARQRFVSRPECPEVELPLTSDETALTRRMAMMHATQRGLLRAFPLDIERFRQAPDYDLAELPNKGRLLYEQFDWGMTGDRWRPLVGAALRELDLSGGA